MTSHSQPPTVPGSPAKCFWLPTIGYSVIDAINRRACATGSPGYAAATGYANYNGHRVSVAFNDYRHYWITEYFWAGRIVLARGDVEHALRAGLDEYKRGARGTVVMAFGLDEEAAKIAVALGYQPWSEEAEKAHGATWVTEMHALVGEAFEYERHLGVSAVGYLANSKTPDEYHAKVDAALAQQKAARIAARAEVA